MKNFIMAVALLLSCSLIYAAGYDAKYSKPAANEHQIDFALQDWSLRNVVLNGTTYQQIVFDASTVLDKKGWAELPFISAAIQLPANKNVDVVVSYTEYEDYNLDYSLVPSRGVLYRNQNIEEIPYEIDPNSLVNKFYPSTLATADEPFIIRDIRGTAVRVYPFQYNPVTNTLRVYSNVSVKLVENNQVATNPLLKENMNPVREAISMYQSLFLNFDASKYDLTMAQYGEILVITTARDEADIENYIQWKKEKGYIVHKEVVATGTNVKSLIQTSYNNNNNILYVQLVGDWADIKSDNSIDSSPTDPKMGCVVGTDNFPEIAIGRFSCSNSTQLMTQINKTIDYEKTPNMEANWREAFIGIGSDEGSGQGDDGEMDKTHIQRIYTQRLDPFTYDTHYENYAPGASASTLGNHVNAGASTIAYCGHGSETSFVTTGFNNSNVNQLTNGDKLPFIVSVACVNGAFHISSDCFAEAWLKKQGGGAVVTWMSSINQPWTPPMRGEDYFYDILIGGFDYSAYSGQNGITTTEQRTTWGSITVNSFNLMLTESQTSSDIETAHTWVTFGDASLQLRTKQPEQLLTSNTAMLVGMDYSTILTANGVPVANALVCISQNDVYYSDITDGNGSVTIPNDFQPGDVLLVASAFNTTTIYENIECIPADGSYVISDGYSLAGDGILSFGETSALSITMKNVGTDPTTTNTTVTISCDDPLLTIVNGTATYGPMASGASLTVENGFSIKADEEITNGQTFTVNVTAVNGADTWVSKIYVSAYRPIINYNGVAWQGAYVPGESLNLQVAFENIGGFSALNATATLTTTSSYVTINNATVEYGTIAPTGIANGTFNITISNNVPDNEVLDFHFAFASNGGVITAEGDFSLSNSCNVIFNLQDSYGDGWNGASLTVAFNDGTPSQTLTLSSGSTGSYTIEINSGTTVTVSFNSGSWNSECSFDIQYEDGTLIYQNSGTPQAGVQCTFVCNCGATPNVCDPVTNLEGSADGTTVTLTWNAPEGADYYTVTENGVNVGDPYTTTLVRENAPEGDNNYCVYAIYNSTGCTSEAVCLSINVSSGPCDAPTGLTAEVNGVTVALSWNASEYGTSYNIYKNGTMAGSTATTSYTVEDLAQGEEFCFTVTSVCGGGESEHSNEACVTTAVCEAPSNFVASVEGNDITMSWEGTGESYIIYTTDDEQVATTTELSLTIEAYYGEEYCLYVVSVCDFAVSAPSNTACVTTDECYAPGALTVSAEYNVVTLNWTPTTTADTYSVYKDGELVAETEEATYTDNVEYAQTYYYSVAANCSDLQSEHTTDQYITTVCSAPANLEAAMQNNAVILTWNASDAATSYNLYRNNEVLVTGVTELTYTDVEVQAEQKYCYDVTAVSEAGESGHSDAVCVDYTSISDYSTIDVTVYPNPTTGSVLIECEGMKVVNIYGLAGNLVKSISVDGNDCVADLTDCASGTYFINIVTDSGKVVRKVVKM
ncbi:MAG: C25 family cysteine peptidase [Bacteroidales bacterium]|jgi:hypothetical protein|nr:C25 family cysteine peptidase [Bacteroidales bacterium]MDD3914072.1 C25 family cysteine peptidase [Bacteroidales bacterium]MDD4634026.1 C25 family cysteine peptidase [Bacteroidales bacterium]